MMPAIPYGLDPLNRHFDEEDPWENLRTIDHFLQDREAIPPDLAMWLGLAIQHSNRDPKEFLRRLGLARKSGRVPHKHAASAWFEWGARVCHVESNGLSPEAAVTEVLQQYQNEVGQELSRSQLQKWRAKYRKAEYEASAAN